MMGMAHDTYYSTKSQNSSLVWPTKLFRGVGDEGSETRAEFEWQDHSSLDRPGR